MAVKTKDRLEWMSSAPYDMSAERDLIKNLITWFQLAGWHEARDAGPDYSTRGEFDAVIETGRGKILVKAIRRDEGDLGRIEILTYPRFNRIYLAQQPDGAWRIETESNTFDARQVDSNGLKSVLEEMLRIR